MSRVALVKASGSVDDAVRRAVGLVGGLAIKPGMKVVIKPNVCNAKNPHGMVITDFGIVESAVRMVREAGCEPLVVESDNIADTGDNRVRDSGLKARLDEWGVRFLNLSTDECTPKQVAGTEIMVPNTMQEANYVINLAKIKTCSHTLVTLSIKNLFGCFKEAKKSRLHKRLDDVLPFLAKTIRSDMNIVDGLVCMEGNGPVVGNPKELGLIVAGTNPVSVDSFCSTLMGFDAKEIRHIANAEVLGIGSLSYEPVGDPWEGFACRFERPYSLKANIKSLGAVKDVYLTR